MILFIYTCCNLYMIYSLEKLGPSSTHVHECSTDAAFKEVYSGLPYRRPWRSVKVNIVTKQRNDVDVDVERSIIIMPVCLPTLAFLARSSMSMMSWISHDHFSLKPCCRSYKIPCPSRCLTMFEAKICSSTLQRMQVREIGR